MAINIGTDLKWSVTYDNKEIISSVRLVMILGNNKILGENEIVKNAISEKINQILEAVVANKSSKIIDEYNSLLIKFKSGLVIRFRAYNDGLQKYLPNK